MADTNEVEALTTVEVFREDVKKAIDKLQANATAEEMDEAKKAAAAAAKEEADEST